MLSANQILNKGRYRITKELGSDGAGALFEAYDTVNKSTVVLREITNNPGKVLTTSQREVADAIFIGNAKVLTKIQHGNLVAVQDYFTEVGSQYLVLENIAGFDLTEFTRPDRPRPTLDQIFKWVFDLLQALEYLHKVSPPIIHGNLNPKSIRFRDEQAAKLLALDVQSSSSDLPVPQAGSPKNIDNYEIHYQPLESYWNTLDQVTQRSILRDYDDRSERILRNKLDARSDLYSLGACMYHVLTGIQPISALDRACALREGKTDPLVNISQVHPSVPEVISAVFMKALSIRREFRFYSAAVMAENLKEAVANTKRNEEPVLHEVSIVLDEETPLEALPAEYRKDELEAAIASDELEVRLELELTQAEERQRQLEAEQKRLELEQHRIEERRAALEAERVRHQAEKERLEQKARLESERKENQRRAEEKKRLEAEALRERELASKRLVEIEAELEQRRSEAEKIEREIEEERLRAVARLNKIREEKERTVNEQRRQAEALKQELERAEQRLRAITKTSAEPQLILPAEVEVEVVKVEEIEAEKPTLEEQPAGKAFAPTPAYIRPDAPEITFHSVSGGSSSRKPAIVAGVLGVVLAVFGAAFWFVSQSSSSQVPMEVGNPDLLVQEAAQDPQPPAEPVDVLNVESNTNSFISNSANGSINTSSEKQVPSEGNSVTSQQSPAQSITAQAPGPQPAKKRVAAPTKPQFTKKVTVDDLINDN